MNAITRDVVRAKHRHRAREQRRDWSLSMDRLLLPCRSDRPLARRSEVRTQHEPQVRTSTDIANRLSSVEKGKRRPGEQERCQHIERIAHRTCLGGVVDDRNRALPVSSVKRTQSLQEPLKKRLTHDIRRVRFRYIIQLTTLSVAEARADDTLVWNGQWPEAISGA